MGQTVSELLESDERLVVILAEISTGYFEEGVLVPDICAAMGRIPVPSKPSVCRTRCSRAMVRLNNMMRRWG